MSLQTWLLSLQDVTRQQFDCPGAKRFGELLKLDSPVSQKVGRVENLTQFKVLFFTFLVQEPITRGYGLLSGRIKVFIHFKHP